MMQYFVHIKLVLSHLECVFQPQFLVRLIVYEDHGDSATVSVWPLVRKDLLSMSFFKVGDVLPTYWTLNLKYIKFHSCV